MTKSLKRRLISSGFGDLDKSARFLDAPELSGVDESSLFDGLALAADPDQALQSLVRLLEKSPELAALVNEGAEASEALFRLLGASEALAEFLMRHPENLDVVRVRVSPEPTGADASALRESLLRSVGADPSSAAPVASVAGQDAYRTLRTQYRRHLCELAIRDLGSASPEDFFPTAARELADMAAAALDAALAVSRAELAEHHDAEQVADIRLAVIGMGKCGAGELNYISDVDVIYVIESAHTADAEAAVLGTALATGISRAIFSAASEPGLWEVDAALRPEGKDGPLVRTLESHLNYYQRWAKSWEFQALLKARAVAGDLDLGRRYEQMLAPLIWSSSERDGFVQSVQSMRRRVTEHIPAHEEARQIKLGAGGLRDVEFTVQLLQLVHAKADESLRCKDTTSAIAALSETGYIGRSDARAFDQAYRYLRVLEHRIQLMHMRRTHLMPVQEAAQRALARSMVGALSTARPSAESLLEQWQGTKRSVRGLHERIFYRPVLATAAHLSAEDVRLSPEAAGARLAALGYLDPKGALRHIQALTGGISRRASLQRQLLPVLLAWLAEGVDPDAGLLGFRRISEALGTSPWYLGMLRDSKAAAERLCHILSNSRFITDLLEVSPEAAAWLGSDKELVPHSFETLWQEIRFKLDRHPEPAEAVRLIRLIRRREILRIAIADSSSVLDQHQVAEALADADRAAILGALHVAEKSVFGREDAQTSMLVVAMGRQGGREIRYGSDADVLYVHRPLPGADKGEAQQQAEKIVAQMSTLLKQRCSPPILAERILEVDANLRPEGKNGALVRSFDSYREYYGRWSQIWEAQALLRARPIAGDDELGDDFVALINPLRYREGLSEHEALEIRRIKARVEAERLPRGADPARQLKLGRGGLSDVEWLIQLLQLEYAHRVAGLRTTSTIDALTVAAEEGLLPEGDTQTLIDSWRLASRIRSANVIWSGKASDLLPSSRRDLEAVARWCGYEAGMASELEEDYLRLSRRARGVFEKYFFDD